MQHSSRKSWLLLAALLPAAGFCDGLARQHATFAGDPRTTVAVRWHAATNLAATVVYGTNLATLAPWPQIEIVPSAGAYEQHALLTNLSAGQACVYIINDADGTLTGTFRTAPNGSAPYTFAVDGDVQGKEAPRQAWRDAGRWLISQDVAFAVLVLRRMYVV
jgi:hypothetical protein